MYSPISSYGTYIPIKLILNADFPIDNKATMSNVDGYSQFYILKRKNRECDLVVDYA